MRGWNGVLLLSVFDLQINCPQFTLMRFAPRTLTRFQSGALITGVGFCARGSLGGYCARFPLLPDTRPWPRNTHYRHHPSSSGCALTLGRDAHGSRRTSTQEACKHSWGLNSERPEKAAQALKVAVRQREPQPGLCFGTSRSLASKYMHMWASQRLKKI